MNPMPQWEYRTINLCDLPRNCKEAELLDEAGDEGWELVAITSNNLAYLKRPIPEPGSVGAKRRKSAAAATETLTPVATK